MVGALVEKLFKYRVSRLAYKMHFPVHKPFSRKFGLNIWAPIRVRQCKIRLATTLQKTLAPVKKT